MCFVVYNNQLELITPNLQANFYKEYILYASDIFFVVFHPYIDKMLVTLYSARLLHPFKCDSLAYTFIIPGILL
jgi:hypothetical protein